MPCLATSERIKPGKDAEVLARLKGDRGAVFVQRKLGKEKTAEFARLYTAPGVDHVGSGAPANVDMLGVLVDWVENGKAPGDLEVTEQKVEAPSFETMRSLPLCRWPAWPHYKSGPVNRAPSFACAP